MKHKEGGWDPEASPAFWINRASKALLRHFDAGLRPFGFAMSHLPVLRALADGRARSPTELAVAAGVEQPSMAETLARMERDGVVEREPNPDDRRGVLVSVTRQTRARFPRAKAALIEGERAALASFTEAERVLLRQLLQRVVKNLEDVHE